MMGTLQRQENGEVGNLCDTWGHVWKAVGTKNIAFSYFIYLGGQRTPHLQINASAIVKEQQEENISCICLPPLFEQQQQKNTDIQLIFSILHQDFECNRIFILHWNVYYGLNSSMKWTNILMKKKRWLCKKKTTPNCWWIKHAVFPVSSKYMQKSATLSPHRPYMHWKKPLSFYCGG